MPKMEVYSWLGVAGVFLMLYLQLVHGKKVDMISKCHGRHSDAIELDGSDVAYVNIDGSNWRTGDSCVLTFKADDTFDDLKLKFTKYNLHDCDVKFQVYTSLTGLFSSTGHESTYSCSNAPLLNWKSTKNRYVRLKISRRHDFSRDFDISLELSVEGYTFNSSTSSSEGLEFSAVIGVIVMVIVSAIVFTIIVVWCCCIRSRRSSGTVLRQNYQAAPVASSNSTNTTQTWGPQTQGIQPSAPYPTLPGGHVPPGSYPYGYGYPQGVAVPPAYLPTAPVGYPVQPPGYPQQAAQPGIEPTAPPQMSEPPPPYPGGESTPFKGY